MNVYVAARHLRFVIWRKMNNIIDHTGKNYICKLKKTGELGIVMFGYAWRKGYSYIDLGIDANGRNLVEKVPIESLACLKLESGSLVMVQRDDVEILEEVASDIQ